MQKPELKYLAHTLAFEISTDVATFVDQCRKEGDSASDVYRLALEWGLACMMAEAAEVQFTSLKTEAIHQSTYFGSVLAARKIKKPSKPAPTGDAPPTAGTHNQVRLPKS